MKPAGMSPTRYAFLLAALRAGNLITRGTVSMHGRAIWFSAGEQVMPEHQAIELARLGWIEPVSRADGRPGTEAIKGGPRMMTIGYRYRVTDAGKQAVNWTEDT